ncbi:MAG: methylmalonyl-CoA carboxyltransferase [Spirochaetota bacterium]|nr:MAG: methylmalonyl-CoA carboxyltransferase [Spirochaetota bacterium]
MSIDEELKELSKRRSQIVKGGGEDRIKAQHDKGKLTARERIDFLFDKGSFTEVNAFMRHRSTELGIKELQGDGVVTGYGTIEKRLVFCYSQDFTVMGGSLGEIHAQKICYIMDQARKTGAPLIGLNDSGGARIQEGVDSLKGYGEIFYRNTIASGVIPQITAILGPCAGGAVYSPAIGDFILMAEGSSMMFITGPQVIKTVTGEDVSPLELGGAVPHSQKSGMAHLTGENDEEVLSLIKELLSYIPSNNLEDSPVVKTKDNPLRKTASITKIIPEDPNAPYDVRDIITEVIDDGKFFEIHSQFAGSIVVGFSRIDGKSIGIIANNPVQQAGVLDINSADKASRFIRFCDAFNIPILTFVDTPGYMPGVQQEYGGIIRHGAKLLYAYSEATVPMLTVILRKAYGGAYIAMASKHLRADCVFALPSAEIAVMGPEGAANIIFKKEIENSEDSERTRKEKIEEYKEKFANPYKAAESGYVDDVIDPALLRIKLINALKIFESKREDFPRKKHGNIPL